MSLIPKDERIFCAHCNREIFAHEPVVLYEDGEVCSDCDNAAMEPLFEEEP